MSIGTLETIYLTPSNLLLLLVGTSFVSLITSTFFTLLTLSIGIGVFGITLVPGNLFYASLVLLITFLSMLGIGMIVAGVTLVTKSAGELVAILNTVMMFLSGVYFPVSLLPQWAQNISYAIPLTHSLDSLRKILLVGGGWSDVANSFWPLLLLTIILLLVGYFIFYKCLHKARADGSLVQY